MVLIKRAVNRSDHARGSDVRSAWRSRAPAGIRATHVPAGTTLVVLLGMGFLPCPARGAVSSRADSVQGRVPTPAELRLLNRTFERTKTVHVTTGRHTFAVREPDASPAGLAFERVLNFPPRRPALMATNWDTIPPPANPLPWAAIRTIERVHSGTGAGALGGAIGAAVVVTPLAALILHAQGGSVTGEVLSYGAGAVAVGALLGALFGGMAESRDVLYDASDAISAVPPTHQPNRRLAPGRWSRLASAGGIDSLARAAAVPAVRLEEGFHAP